MEELLVALDRLIDRLSDRAFFRRPAAPHAIDELEKAIGRKLPADYRRFLLAHDGGFIFRKPFDPCNEAQPARARWNSNYLRGCEDLRTEYLDDALRARDIDPAIDDWPYVAFCHTDGQELLVFGRPGPDGSSPVLDAHHEVFHPAWAPLVPDFAAFLARYIEAEGFPETVASTC